MNKKRDIAQFATFQILARSFEIEQAFRFKQRERAVNLRQREVEERRKAAAKATLGAEKSLFEAKKGTEDDLSGAPGTLDDPVDTGAGDDDDVHSAKATFSTENDSTHDTGNPDEQEAKIEDADGDKFVRSGSSGEEDELNSSDEDNGENQPRAWSKDQRDIDALDAERLLAIGRPESPPAGTTVFGKKFYTKDQVRFRFGCLSECHVSHLSFHEPADVVLLLCVVIVFLETPSATSSTPQRSHVIAGCQCSSTHRFITCGYNRGTTPESTS